MMKRHKNWSDYSVRSRQRFLRARANRDSSSEEEAKNDNEVCGAPPERNPLPPQCPQNLEHHDNILRNESSSSSASSSSQSSSEKTSSSSDQSDSDSHEESGSDSDNSMDDAPPDSPDDSPDDSPEEDFSDEDNDNIYQDDDPPLYEGAPITVAESLLSIMSLVVAHNLSGSCLEDILELIAIHCPVPNLCKSSLYKFKKYFHTLKSPLIRRYYCSICFTSLDTRDELCWRCNSRKGTSYFLQMPIVPQLTSLYKRPGFYEKVRGVQNRRCEVDGNFEDIYDGSIYKSLSTAGNVLSNQNNISLTWYTDGVRIFRSSKSEIWPFFFTINELPYLERCKIENVLIAGLWFGPKKPLPSLFLRHMYADLNQVRQGINVVVPHLNNPVRVQAVVMCGTCDLPAKALFLNMVNHAETFGCQICKLETIQLNPDGPKRYFPFRRNLILRTDEETRIFAQNAQQLGRSVIGVKGPSAIAPFVRNPIEYTAIDVMHGCWLGVAKKLARIWFDEDFKDHPASLWGFVRIVDERLTAIHPPHFVQMRPRTIAGHFKWWKASERKSFLMIYSLPILEDIMARDYFDHHKLLVLGINLLNMDSVSPAMIDLASRVLFEYVGRFGDLYGRTHFVSNVHSLLHLPLMVRRFGPLWTTSCFPYETLNGVLKKFVTGTRFADLQIYSAASIFLNMSAFKEDKLVHGRRPRLFCERLSQYQRRLPLQIISERMGVVGKYYRTDPLPLLVQDAIQDLEIEHDNILLFYRMFDFKLRHLFSSVAYTRVTRTNSTCVKFCADGTEMFGIVQTFIRVKLCGCVGNCMDCGAQYYAVIRDCNVVPAFRAFPGGPIPLIHRCTHTEEYRAVEVDRLLKVCFYISIRDTNVSIIVEPTNTAEIE